MLPLITSIADLPPVLAASAGPEEKSFLDEISRKGLLPFAVTPHYASLALPDKDDPIRRQFFPDPREALPDPFALDDPLGECRHRAAPRLVHQYPDRALLLAGSGCAGYCRFCFRRVWLSENSLSKSSREDAKTRRGEKKEFMDFFDELKYLERHSEIKEVLVSGGDPLTMDNGALDDLFGRLRAARPGIAIRLCSRVPITAPARLDAQTVSLLAAYRPLRLALHINHPRELSPPSRQALAACVEAGIPVLTQTVLLHGINDDLETLASLFTDSAGLGLSPYYLFQTDLAPGTAHFRVPLKQGLALYRKLGRRIPGAALPAYALDLPGGGGKITLDEKALARERLTEKGAAYVLLDTQGGEWHYPKGVLFD